MKSFTKIIIPLLCIILGIFVGSSWKSHEAKEDNNKSETNDPMSVSDSINAISFQELNEFENRTIALFEDATPSVVFITTSKLQRDYWRRDVTEIPRGTGSGFVWDDLGHIVTNYHVIKGADRATVTFADQSTYPATLVGIAPEKDLAVLKIEAPAEKLKAIKVSSSQNLKVGQSVYAIGNPFGLDQTLTTGVISALGREINVQNGQPIRDVIQTDAAINPGNSGGPLLNSSGKLIGVNTAIYSPSGAYAGVGFSIPVDVVKWVVPDLISYGVLKRPFLGVELLTNQQVAAQLDLKGALIINVSPGSGAAKAGLKGTRRKKNGEIEFGDIVKRIENYEINSNLDLIFALEKFEAGDEIKVQIERNDEQLDFMVKLGNAK